MIFCCISFSFYFFFSITTAASCGDRGQGQRGRGKRKQTHPADIHARLPFSCRAVRRRSALFLFLFFLHGLMVRIPSTNEKKMTFARWQKEWGETACRATSAALVRFLRDPVRPRSVGVLAAPAWRPLAKKERDAAAPAPPSFVLFFFSSARCPRVQEKRTFLP